MKKTIISLSFATIALFTASSVFAQNDNNSKEQKKIENRGERKLDRPQPVNPFEGINLTEQQKTALKALAEEQKQNRTKKTDKQKAEQKADKQKKAQERMEAQKNARKEYLAKVKSILTPEQYCQFLENNYVNQSQKMESNPGKKQGNGPRNGQGGPRPGQRN